MIQQTDGKRSIIEELSPGWTESCLVLRMFVRQ
jgi:hypothetical protein